MEIILRKSGNFYSAFDNDAIILHYIFGYKIKDKRVGFPVSSIDKITNKLNKLHINYYINDKDLRINFEDNKYNIYMIEAKNKVLLGYKIDEIMSLIDKLDYNDLNNLINVIEDFVNERGKTKDNN